LLVALVGIDFSAERSLRRDYEHAGLEQLKRLPVSGRCARPFFPRSPTKTEEIAGLQAWYANAGKRRSCDRDHGKRAVLADSQSEMQTTEITWGGRK